MKFTEKIKAFKNSEEFSQEAKDFIKNVISAATGDLVAAAEALSFLLKSPKLIMDILFWEKFTVFLEGVFLDEKDVKQLSTIFAEKAEQESYARRIIKVIDDIDTHEKIIYIINLTRALLAEHIVKSDYYRLINVIRNTLEEDLKFLSDTIDEKDLKANIQTEFLKQNGLVMQPVISEDRSFDCNNHIFTPLAFTLDKYGLNYLNAKYQYSTTTKSLSEQPIPVTKAGNITATFG